MTSRRFTLGLALCGTLSLIAAGPVTVSASSAADPPQPVELTRADSTATVTLITGDRVRVTGEPGDPTNIVVLPGDGSSGSFLSQEADGDRYVVPTSAVPALAAGRLDPQLFNVTGLVAQGFDDARTERLPLIAEYAPRAVTTRAAPIGPAGAEQDAILPSIDAVALSADKTDTAVLWADVSADLTATPSGRSRSTLRRLWLDRKATTQLDRSTAQVGAPAAWAAGYDGSGVRVAVLDTGVDAAHPDLADQVVDAANFSVSDDHDENGHGSHVASTVAGTGAASDGAKRGVAPGADLLIGKVLDDNGGGYLSDIIEGIEWAVDSEADVVSMSLGAQDYAGCADPLAQAVKQHASQTTFVVAAGNQGPGPHTISSPACASEVITVGAVDRDDATAAFSSRGFVPETHVLKPDLAAPGVGISAAATNGRGDQAYTTMSGTSMATPHVAGATALLLHKHPELSPTQVKARLLSAAENAVTGRVDEVGAGRLDVGATVTADVVGPGTVDAGGFTWPQRPDASSDVDVTYTNTSDQPVTLRLAIEALQGNDGEAAPAGLASLPEPTITVPAHGTASAPLRLHPGQPLPPGQYGDVGGRLVATSDDGGTVTTAFSAFLEPKTVDLTIRVVGRDGQAPDTAGLDIANVDTGETVWRYLADDDTVSVRMRAGATYLDAVVSEYDAGSTSRTGMVDTVSVLSIPERQITEDTTIVLDAGKAREVTVRGDRPLEDHGSYVGFGRWTDHWVHTRGVIDTGTINRVYAWSSGEAETGEFDFHSLWRLGAPRLSLRTIGRDGIDVPAMYTTSIYAVDNKAMFRGTDTAELVDAGTGTPEELAAAGVAGKVALIENDTTWMSRQIASDAAEAGAAAVLLHRATPGRWSTGSSNQLPMATIETSTATALLDRLATGPVWLRWRGQPYTPYMYNLANSARGKVPQRLRHRIDEDALARVKTTWHRVGEIPQTLEWANLLPQWHPGEHIAPGLPLRAPVSGARVDYYSPGTWRRSVNSKPRSGFPMNGIRTFTRGERATEHWFRGILRPVAGRVFETGALRTVAVRRNNLISFDLRHGYWGDSEAGHWSPDMLANGRIELFRDGDSLGSGGTLAGGFRVPSGPARYELRLTTTPYDEANPEWQRSSTVETRFGFRSDSTVGIAPLPLMFPGYQVELDADNTAPARPVRIRLGATGQRGYAPGEITEASLAYSYDGGQTWTPAPIRHRGEGWLAEPDHRRASGESVTLRVRLTGADGASVTQTVDDAYRVR